MTFSVVLSSVCNDERHELPLLQAYRFETRYYRKLIDSKIVDSVLVLGQATGIPLAHYCANIPRNVSKQLN